MESQITRDAAWALLRKYNKDPFHLQHALTVEGVMRWYAEQLGFADEVDFWGMVGLLHDIDFELYPEEHCIKAPELLREGGVGEDMIHAICSHAYGLHVDVKPEHLMEKVLYATDELTGLIWAAALMRPSKSVQDMELKSLNSWHLSEDYLFFYDFPITIFSTIFADNTPHCLKLRDMSLECSELYASLLRHFTGRNRRVE